MLSVSSSPLNDSEHVEVSELLGLIMQVGFCFVLFCFVLFLVVVVVFKFMCLF